VTLASVKTSGMSVVHVGGRPQTSDVHEDVEEREAVSRDVYAEISQSVDFSVVDGIFDAFLNTNTFRNRHFSVDELFRECKPWKRYYKYVHHGVPYIASTLVVENFDNQWVNFKLANNGFEYAPISRRTALTWPRHNCDGWIVVPQVVLADSFRTFHRFMRSVGLFRLKMFYNAEHRRIDVKMYATEPHRTPCVLVTFEPGEPWHPEEDA